MLRSQGPWITPLVVSKARASNSMTTAASEGATAIDLSRGITGRKEGGEIKTTDSDSPQAARETSGGRNEDELTYGEREDRQRTREEVQAWI